MEWKRSMEDIQRVSWHKVGHQNVIYYNHVAFRGYHMGKLNWKVKHAQGTFHSSTHISFNAPFKSYFRRKGSIWKDFLLEEELYNHACPPHVSMLSPVFHNPFPLVGFSAIVTGPHCLIVMLRHFQIDISHSSFLSLHNVQRIWSQPIRTLIICWDGQNRRKTCLT